MELLRPGTARQEFERFVTDWTDHLLRTAYLTARNLPEAEDLVQETLLRVARHWMRIRSLEHPVAYARRILINLAIDSAGKRQRSARELAEPEGEAWRAASADDQAERDFSSVDAQVELIAALAMLPARQRAVIVLRYWEDLPEAEVAAILGCSTGTVKSTASRGLYRLRDLLNASRAEQPAAGATAPQ